MKIALCTALWAGFAAGATFAGPWKDESDKGRWRGEDEWGASPPLCSEPGAWSRVGSFGRNRPDHVQSPNSASAARGGGESELDFKRRSVEMALVALSCFFWSRLFCPLQRPGPA